MVNLTITTGVLYFDNKWTYFNIKLFVEIINKYLKNDFLNLIYIPLKSKNELTNKDNDYTLTFTGTGIKSFSQTLSDVYRLLHQMNNDQSMRNLLLTTNDFKQVYSERALVSDVVELSKLMLDNDLYVEIHYIDVSHGEKQFIIKGDGILSPLYDDEIGAYTIDLLDAEETHYEYNCDCIDEDRLLNLALKSLK